MPCIPYGLLVKVQWQEFLLIHIFLSIRDMREPVARCFQMWEQWVVTFPWDYQGPIPESDSICMLYGSPQSIPQYIEVPPDIEAEQVV